MCGCDDNKVELKEDMLFCGRLIWSVGFLRNRIEIDQFNVTIILTQFIHPQEKNGRSNGNMFDTSRPLYRKTDVNVC